jgi:hypothetical protein
METITTTSSPKDPELKGAMESKDYYWSSDHVESAASPDTPSISPEEERRLVRKMDWHIIPILVSLYVMSFLDRVNIGAYTYNLSSRYFSVY